MNTKQKGTINFLIYRGKGESLYTAVCLDFDIVEQGGNLEGLKKSIEEAAKLHLESILKNNLNDNLLNRRAPEKYWKKLHEAVESYEEFLSVKQFSHKQKELTVSDIWNRSSKELVTA